MTEEVDHRAEAALALDRARLLILAGDTFDGPEQINAHLLMALVHAVLDRTASTRRGRAC